MNRIGFLIVCFVLALAGIIYLVPGLKREKAKKALTQAKLNSEEFATWQEFKPRSGLFTVLLPHAPQYAKDLVPIPGTNDNRRYDMYASEKIDGSLFLVSVITYPPEVDTTSAKDVLGQVIDELMHSKASNRLKSMQESHFQERSAIDFEFENQQFIIKGKVFLDGKIVYVVNYVTEKEDFDPNEYQTFIESFKLLKQKDAA